MLKHLRAFLCSGRLFVALAVAACLVPALARGATPEHPFEGVDWTQILRSDPRITVDKGLSERAGAPFFLVGNAAFGTIATYGIVVGDVGGVEEDVAAVPLQRITPPVVSGYLIFTEASPRRYVSVLSGHDLTVAIRDLRLIETQQAEPPPPHDIKAKTYTVYTVAVNRFTTQWSLTVACRPPPDAGQILYCRFYPYNDNLNVSRTQITRALFAIRSDQIAEDFASARAVATRQRHAGEIVFYRGALYAYGVSFKTGTFTVRTLESLTALE